MKFGAKKGYFSSYVGALKPSVTFISGQRKYAYIFVVCGFFWHCFSLSIPTDGLKDIGGLFPHFFWRKVLCFAQRLAICNVYLGDDWAKAPFEVAPCHSYSLDKHETASVYFTLMWLYAWTISDKRDSAIWISLREHHSCQFILTVETLLSTTMSRIDCLVW